MAIEVGLPFFKGLTSLDEAKVALMRAWKRIRVLAERRKNLSVVLRVVLRPIRQRVVPAFNLFGLLGLILRRRGVSALSWVLNADPPVNRKARWPPKWSPRISVTTIRKHTRMHCALSLRSCIRAI